MSEMIAEYMVCALLVSLGISVIFVLTSIGISMLDDGPFRGTIDAIDEKLAGMIRGGRDE